MVSMVNGDGTEVSSSTKISEEDSSEGDSERIDLLIEAYEQVNEEARYRDKLMHNSYYLVVIALILTVGNLLPLITADNLRYPLKIMLGGASLLLGIAVLGVGVVMLTYNKKRVNAEGFRGEIEQELNNHFQSSNYASGDLEEPFNINRRVLGSGEDSEIHSDLSDRVEWFFRTKLSVSKISLFLLCIGGSLGIVGLALLILGF